MPSSLPVAGPCTPNSFGIEGPVISASKMPAEWPIRRIATASMALVMLLPTPPLPETTPITFLIWLLACGGSCCGALRLGQSAPQLLQSWVHSSLIYTFSFSPGRWLRRTPLLEQPTAPEKATAAHTHYFTGLYPKKQAIRQPFTGMAARIAQ